MFEGREHPLGARDAVVPRDGDVTRDAVVARHKGVRPAGHKPLLGYCRMYPQQLFQDASKPIQPQGIGAVAFRFGRIIMHL